jgi:hypothetical protein
MIKLKFKKTKMICEVCHYHLGTNHSGSVVCPQCRHVNHFGGHPAHHAAHASHTYAHHDRHHIHRKHARALMACFAAFFILAFVSLINFLAIYNVTQAAALDSQGQYRQASATLGHSLHWLLMPSVSRSTQAESQKNQKWLAYSAYQAKAEQYIKQGKYQDALGWLGKISKDFPTYKTVADDIKAASQNQNATQAVQVAAAHAAAAKKAAGQAVTSPTSTSPGCSAPTGLVGKKYVNTDDFKAILAASSVTQIQQLLQDFFNQYGLSVEVQNISANEQFLNVSSVSYAPVTDSDVCYLRSTALTLIDEWAKYPKDWVRNSDLQSIILIKNMKRVFDGASYPVSATYDVFDSQMWYDIGYSGDYMREAIHHEFYHLLVYNYNHTSSHDDSTWLSYNPPGFSYGKGGASCYVPGNDCLNGEHPAPGFVTGYAASAIAEDQAETYAYLMTDTYYHHLKSWLPSDPLLASKVKLQEQFIDSGSDTMSGSYFDSINP